MEERQIVNFRDLGRLDYKSAWDYQEELLQANVRSKALRYARAAGDEATAIGETDASTRHYLLFVEHPPVYTLGKSGQIENVLISDELRSQKGIEFFRTNRGGDITFHGPQQLVGYPILDLEKFETDIGKYLRQIEEVIIRTLAEYGITAGRSAGETGVWLDADQPGRERKICAIGVRSSRWITMHGFALNVNTDLSHFDFIIPCGIRNKQVTSMEKELGYSLNFAEVQEAVKKQFEQVFGVSLVGF